MGGLSQSQTRTDSTGELLFEGSLVVEGGGFASTRLPALPPAAREVLAGGSALVLRVRGDGLRYQLRAYTAGAGIDGVAYASSFSTTRGVETTARLPIAELRPTWRGREVSGAPPLRDAADVHALSLMIVKDGGQRGDFALALLAVAVEVDGGPAA